MEHSSGEPKRRREHSRRHAGGGQATNEEKLGADASRSARRRASLPQQADAPAENGDANAGDDAERAAARDEPPLQQKVRRSSVIKGSYLDSATAEEHATPATSSDRPTSAMGFRPENNGASGQNNSSATNNNNRPSSSLPPLPSARRTTTQRDATADRVTVPPLFGSGAAQ